MLREKLICLAEDLAKASSGCIGTAQVEESHRRAVRGFDILRPQLRIRRMHRPSCYTRREVALSYAMMMGRPTNNHSSR